MKQKLILFLPLLLLTSTVWSQDYDVIELKNPSFEERPHPGVIDQSGIRGWFDCSRFQFRDETPPDIHPGIYEDYFGNSTPANHGATYLGMVVRDNDTWESVSQRLEIPLRAGQCYEITVDLARSPTYKSPTKSSLKEAPYTTPTVLRILGGAGVCATNQLLAVSDPVAHSDWRRYSFKLEPKLEVRSIRLEAFYSSAVMSYNGHILVDNLSTINEVPCPGEEIAAVEKTKKEVPPHKRRKPKPKVKEEPKKEVAEEVAKAEPKKTLNLERREMYKGKKINIDNLYFTADAAIITAESYDVLDEVVDFMKANEDIKIEIGGHTNRTPSHAYCDSLSRVRAKAVATYINKEGVPASQLQFRGYGKRKPVTFGKSKKDRARNQRVEIKILSIGK